MAIFIWYSKSSQETGKWLADKLKVEAHGVVPPRDFEGTVICWGATPSKKFKWEKRNIQSIFNDPRVIRPLLNREDLFKKVAEVDIPVTKFITLPAPPALEEGAAPANPPAAPIEHSYTDLCTALGVTEQKGFIACTAGGFKHVSIDSFEALMAAVADGRTCVTTTQFTDKERIRVFVSGGVVVGATKYAPTVSGKAMPDFLTNKVAAGWGDLTVDQISAVFSRAAKLKLITTTRGAWAPHALANLTIRNKALTVAAALKFDFCAVDFSTDGSTVINILTTPNLREVSTVQTAITNIISSWVYKNSRTPKDILLEVISGSTCEEASSLLEELSSLKGAIKLELRREKGKKSEGGEGGANKVASGADSPPAKQT